MSKGLIAFIAITFVAVAVAVFLFMKQSADAARAQSDELLKKFKTIDKDLQTSNERLDTLNTINIDSLIKANK